MNTRFALIAVIATAGCAKTPESIAPSYVSPLLYQQYDCSQLALEGARVSEALTQASAQQRQARTDDTVGVLLIGVPTASLSGGNVADQVARLKGENKTVRQTMIQKKCESEVIPTEAVTVLETEVQPSEGIPSGPSRDSDPVSLE